MCEGKARQRQKRERHDLIGKERKGRMIVSRGKADDEGAEGKKQDGEEGRSQSMETKEVRSIKG